MESRSSFISALWGVVLLGLLVISGHAQAQTSVTNTATLSPPTGWRCASPTEQDGCTVRSSVTNQVGSPELSILKQADQTQPVVGGSVVYTLEVANNGNLATAGVITVRDVLPAGLSFVSAAGDGWLCTASGNVVICTRTAAVAANAQAPVITVTASVLPAALPQVINTATVAGGGDARCPTESPNTQACGSSVTTPVVQPVVTVAKAANPASGSTVQRGDIINYTLTATVSGAATVATTTLTDTLSSGLRTGPF